MTRNRVHLVNLFKLCCHLRWSRRVSRQQLSCYFDTLEVFIRKPCFQQEEWQLKDRFKPLYYATLHFLQDEHPTDYLRMGPELRETVDDVLAEVAQMAIDYA